LLFINMLINKIGVGKYSGWARGWGGSYKIWGGVEKKGAG